MTVGRVENEKLRLRVNVGMSCPREELSMMLKTLDCQSHVIDGQGNVASLAARMTHTLSFTQGIKSSSGMPL